MIWLIFGGHLRASDPVLYMAFNFTYGFRWWCCGIMMICYLISMYIQVLLMDFSWVCRTLDWLRMLMESMDLLGLQIESGSGLFMVCVFMLLHMWHMTDILWCWFWIVGMFCWWMQVDDCLLIILTFGIKGSCMTTIDIEGVVWQQPCHNLLALSLWLKL